jgi:hypothetical protein
VVRGHEVLALIVLTLAFTWMGVYLLVIAGPAS